MKHVLRCTTYPNLYGLGLYNMEEETARCLFTGKKISINQSNVYLDFIIFFIYI